MNGVRPAHALVCGGVGLLLAASVAACARGPFGTRTVRAPVFKEGQVRVFLRHQQSGGRPLELGFEHPRSISSVRLSRILAGVDVRERDRKNKRGELHAAMSTDLAFLLGEGMSKAFGEADPNQEIVVMAIATRKRHGIFAADYLTSLVAWIKDDRLWVHFGEIDKRLSGDPSERPKEPERSETKGKFRLVKSTGVRPVGSHTLAADWRDAAFSKSAPSRTRGEGRELRRTVLMEEEGARDLEDASEQDALSPSMLRALADLEEERLTGTLSEDEYRRRRQEILNERE